MNLDAVSQIADAVLYEGYLLYPYRATAVKNQRRFTFGCLLPPGWLQSPGSAERSFLHTECLLEGNQRTQIEVVGRFLRLIAQVDGNTPLWPDVAVREIEQPTFTLEQLLAGPQEHDFALEATRQVEGALMRTLQAIGGTLSVSAERVDDNAFKLIVHLENRTTISGECHSREDALAWSMLSCHLLLGVRDGNFLSLLDPPLVLANAAAACRNVGVYPVLAGDPERRDIILAAPIMLGDYPRIAPASPGDLFDGTEMDEMLTLRIRTLSEDEKQAITDPRAATMLKRSDAMPDDQLLGLHGAWQRDDLAPGTRVRLWPSGLADGFDLALAGLTAVVVSIDTDLEGREYVSVAIDDDPGRDLGIEGKPGHRFYFRPDEVEPLDQASRERKRPEERMEARLLIAGIGNIFFGDDAFGVEVTRRLAEKSMPVGVVVKDFGIRGFDLACALQDGYDMAILVDAVGRGKPPGTVSVLDLDGTAAEAPKNLEMHHLDPVQVLRLVQQMGGTLPKLRLVGCEPASLEPAANLSEPVRSAVSEAVAIIDSLIAEWSVTHEKK